MISRRASWLLFVLFGALSWFLAIAAIDKLARHVNPCTADASQCYSIQGLYSKRDCPGQHAWFVESEGKQFFMGCRS
jgi:hypothetical protein